MMVRPPRLKVIFYTFDFTFYTFIFCINHLFHFDIYHVNSSDSSVSCGVCSLTFRDTNIAMLHQKLVHSQNHLINSQTEMIPHNESDDRNLSSKRW